MYIKRRDTAPHLDLGEATVGGVLIEGKAKAWVLHTGAKLQMVEFDIEPGFHHPWHNHPTHESVGYVIAGELEMAIGDPEAVQVLKPGDSWHHPQGVYHSTRSRTGATALESFTPVRPEYEIVSETTTNSS